MKKSIVIIFLFLLFVSVLSAQEHRVWILFRKPQEIQRLTNGMSILHNEMFNNLTNTLSIGVPAPVFPYSKNDTLLRLFETSATNEQISFIANNSEVENIYFPSEEELIELYDPSDYMWYCYNDTISWLWHLKKIMADSAWDITKGDTSVKIAIIELS